MAEFVHYSVPQKDDAVIGLNGHLKNVEDVVKIYGHNLFDVKLDTGEIILVVIDGCNYYEIDLTGKEE